MENLLLNFIMMNWGFNGYSFSLEKHWGARAPRKIASVTWTATLGKIFIIDNLQKHHIALLDWCCMCKNIRETMGIFASLLYG